MKLLLIALSTIILITNTLNAENEKTNYEPPKYNGLRFNENWSGLAHAENDDIFNPLKYIPLSNDGTVWMSLGGQARFRIESWKNFAFGGQGERDETFFLTRFLLHSDFHIGEHLRLFIEGKSAFATRTELPGGRRTLDADELDIQNAFVELYSKIPGNENANITLRGGRQELLFGKQRLVSPLDWANTRRTFDGITGNVSWKQDTDSIDITGFWTRPVIVDKFELNEADNEQDFYGVYASFKYGTASFDIYNLALHKDNTQVAGVNGEQDLFTIGFRMGGNFENFDFDFEAASQYGDIDDVDIRAFMFALDLGYTFNNFYSSPRFFFGFDYASGDSDPNDDTVETFNQLFPLGHAYLGFMDFVGRQNIIHLQCGVATKKIIGPINLTFFTHMFWRAQEEDALFHAGGGVLRPGAPGTSREVGTEIDIVAKYPINTHVLLELGYGHFFAGEFIDETGSDEDVDFFYATLQITF